MVWKYTDSPLKKKFRKQRSVKKVTLILFWDMKEPIAIDFLEKGLTVNSAVLPIANSLGKIHSIYWMTLVL